MYNVDNLDSALKDHVNERTTVVEFYGHAHYNDGITIGKKSYEEASKIPDPIDRMQYYIDEDNAEEFGWKVYQAAGGKAGNLELIILSACNLGNFAHNSDSVAQQAADGAGVPVLTPGGYGPYQMARGGNNRSHYVYERNTARDTFFDTLDRLIKEARKKGDKKELARLVKLRNKCNNSKEGQSYITFPSYWTQKDKDDWMRTGKVPRDKTEAHHKNKQKRPDEKTKEEKPSAKETSFENGGDSC